MSPASSLPCADQRPADDERHGDRAGVHREHVLQAERGQPAQRRDLVDGVAAGGAVTGRAVAVMGGSLGWVAGTAP